MAKGRMKSYLIHDNGGRPFRVEIQGMKVSVYKNMDTYEIVKGKFTTIENPEKHLMDFTATEIFVGKKSPKGGYDGLKPKEAEGNSILLRVGSKFVFIGHMIYEFQPMKGDTIEFFYSDIGNNDVPYPYAIGKKYIYILLEDHVAVQLDFFDLKNSIYEQYYMASHRIPMCLKGYDNSDLCKDKQAAKDRVAELKEKTKKFKVKVLQKRSS
jgi:signal peptidase I